jgi:hypothetical protein
LSILAIVGVGLTYWFLQQKIDNQKRQSRKIFEELEISHETRIQETIKSLQDGYQTQLTQKTEELKTKLDSQLQEAINFLQETYQAQLNQAIAELKQPQNSQGQPPTKSLRDDEPRQLNLVNEELQEILDFQYNKSFDSLGGDSNLNKLEPVTKPFDNNSTTTANESKNQESVELLVQPNPETEKTFIESSLVSLSLDESLATSPNHGNTVNGKAKNLDEGIIELGNFGQLISIPKIAEYVNHPDSHLRKLAASALGTIAASQGTKAEIQRAVPLLGKLSRDSESLVRQSAVEALGKIKSEKVIPLLSLALRDSDSDVVKIASAALNKYKYYPRIQGVKPAKTVVKPLKR